MNPLTRHHTPHLLLALLLALNLPALATDQTWTGASSERWGDPANWSGNALPGAGDTVIYNSLSSANLSNWLAQAFSIKGIVLSNVPGPVSINSANTLTVTNGIDMSRAEQPLTISAPVALGTNQMGVGLSWNVATNQVLTVSGNVSGGGGLYKDGFGKLFLNGASSFTGNVTDNGGALWVNNSSALGAGAKTIYVMNNLVGAGLHLNGTNSNINFPANFTFQLSQNHGALFNEVGSNVINGNVYVVSGGSDAHLVANAGSLTLNGPISLSTSARSLILGGAAIGTNNNAISGTTLAFRKVDAGTWTLNGHNNHGGTTSVEGGTLVLGTNATLPNTPAITLLNKATLDVSAVSNTTYSANAFYLSGGSTVQTLAGNGAILGNVAVPPNAATYISPGGANAFGTLAFSQNLSLSPYVALQFDLNASATPGSGVNDLITVGGNLDPQYAYISVSLQCPLAADTYTLLTYSGAELSSFYPWVGSDSTTRYSFTLNDFGSGEVALTVNTANYDLVWSGVYSSAWDLIYNYNWNSGWEPFYNLDTVTFDDSSANTLVALNGTLRPGAVTVTNTLLDYTFCDSGKISGPVGLTKSGSGALTNFVAACDFTGPVVISGGVLSVTNVALNGSPSPLGAGATMTLNGGTLQYTGPNTRMFNRLLTLGAEGGTISVSPSGYLFVTNTISGPGSLTKLGASKQLLIGDTAGGVSISGSNCFDGITYINQGEIQIRNAYALGSTAGKTVVASGADLAVGGSADLGLIYESIDLNGGDGNGSAGTLQVNDANSKANFAGTISLLSNSSVGTVNNGNAVTFIISGPVIGPGALKKLGTNSVVLTCATNSYAGGTLVSSGTLQLGKDNTAGLPGTGPITNNAALVYNHADTTSSDAGIFGTGSLTHNGPGTLMLNGANSYTGPTTLNAGSLMVNGSLGTSTVTVAAGATLGGYGVIGGPVTVNSGGTLALGDAIGTLTINNNLTLNGTNVMKLGKSGTALTNDAIRGIATLTNNGGLTVIATGDALAAGDTFRLFYATTCVGAFTAANLPALGPSVAWDTSDLANGTLKVVARPAFAAFSRLDDRNFQVTFSGSSGSNYRLWAATNLALTPVTSAWSVLASGTFDGAPVVFSDLAATNYPRRFYLFTIP